MERNEAREVSVFGGQGVASGQLAELRRISQVDEVRRFVKYLSGIFEGEMARNGRRGVPQGLNISRWAVSKELSPDMAYLETLPVSVVLTFTIQLATFRYCWTKSGLEMMSFRRLARWAIARDLLPPWSQRSRRTTRVSNKLRGTSGPSC